MLRQEADQRQREAHLGHHDAVERSARQSAGDAVAERKRGEANGGDTIAAIEKYGVQEDISYISTAGGAFLEFLEGKTLPAVEMLEQRAAG